MKGELFVKDLVQVSDIVKDYTLFPVAKIK